MQAGETIRRTELHKTHGGRRQGGTGPSAQTPNVLVFTDATIGPTHGYRDGWDSNGIFHYTGEGQRGDQQFVQGNRAIRDHATENRTLSVFDGAKQTVTYMNEFQLDESSHPKQRIVPALGN